MKGHAMIPKRLMAAMLLISSAILASDRAEVIVQVSTMDALMSGLYDGDRTLRELEAYGDFGIGTNEGLDGEMIRVDGKFYRILADGTAQIPDPGTRTPFATLTFFDSDIQACLPAGTDFPSFMKTADGKIPSSNIFYAVRIKGSFSRVVTRSVPRQSKPYAPLPGILKTRPVLEHKDVDGVMAGFRFPAWFKGIQVPGYHLHFLTGDGRSGGHVLEFTVQRAQMELDETESFRLDLPKIREFLEAELGGAETAGE